MLLIAFGSGIGGVFRYLISTGTYKLFGRGFPYGTLAVNVIGSFLVGLLFIILLERFDDFAEHLRAFLIIGFLGGFTTFSSFSLETINLIEYGEIYTALFNILSSVMLCLCFTWVGILVGRHI